jgi:uncharacterized protein
MPDPDDDALPRARRSPEMRPKPISPEKREEVIVHMAAGLLGHIAISGRIGRSVRVPTQLNHGAPLPRSGGATCACGSGKKYKKCCGGATVN